MADFEKLKQNIEKIRKATAVGENTAERIGGVLSDMADCIPKEECLTQAEYDALSNKDNNKTYYIYEEES